MALIRTVGGTDVLKNNTVYVVGSTNTAKTTLTNGVASVSTPDGTAVMIVSIKDSNFTNLALSSNANMNIAVGGIKKDGTMITPTNRYSASSYPSNDVSDLDVIILNCYALTSVNAVSLTFT